MKYFKARQIYLLFMLILSVVLITGCETGHWLPTGTGVTVTFTVPVNAATDVPVNTKISATFSEVMDPATITTATFIVKQGTTVIPGTVAYSGVTAVFTPASTLAAGTIYTAMITTGARDLNRNTLASDYVWSFTTGAAPDTTAPTVTNTINANGATGVPVNTKVAATFSEAMDPLTITATTFTFKQGTTAVPGSVTYSGVTAVFTPVSTLAANTTYTGTITTGATDLTGNALASDYVWSWTTGATPDTTAPTVTLTVPANAATGVPINTKVSATFSKAMDPLTITNLTFTLKQGTTTISSTVVYSGVTAVLTPLNPLAFSTTYTATITTGAKDLAGNALASNYVWSFTTGAAPDTTAPTVTLTIPANAATGVTINTKVSATFSKAMDPLTITNLTFTLKQGTTAIPGTVIYAGVTAVFTPLSPLAANTTYTATVTTGAKDLAGNALASNYAWSFTTSAAVDIIKPTVIFTTPANVSGVLVNTKVSATFSKVMDPLTINNLTFTLTQALLTVPGTVTYSGRTAVFAPASDLQPATTYTATITTGAKDLAGNALLSNYVWSFTTDTLPNRDTTPPTVTLTVPANGAIGVALNSSINATFSKAMDPLSLTNLTFSVAGVLGVVTYDPLTRIATFNPDSDLAASTTYTATITDGVKDLAGNALVAGLVPNPWTFTTGTGLAPGAVPLGRAATFGIMATGSTASTGATMINGDVALNPGSSQGIPAAQVNGTIHVQDQVAIDAQIDLTAAYIFAWAQGVDVTMIPGADQGASYPYDPVLLTGGMAPGVYESASTMLINTPLVLNAGGNVDAVWIFKIGSSLTTYVGLTPATGGNVLLANGAQAKNVFFVPVAAATIGVDTTFNGNILAGGDVTGQTRAVINGRMLAGESGAGVIDLDTNTVNVPAP